MKIEYGISFNEKWDDYSPWVHVKQKDEIEYLECGICDTKIEAQKVLEDALDYVRKFRTIEEIRQAMKVD